MMLFAWLDGTENSIKRIRLSQDVQSQLTHGFKILMENYLPEDKDLILDFRENVNYKPEDNEIFVINNFEIPEILLQYVRNPTIANILKEDDYENIKYLFLGKVQEENTEIIFILFDKKKIIRPDRGKLWIQYSDDTFSKFDQRAIAIDMRIDAFYRNGAIYFRSLYNIKRIFKALIEEYYREATDEEVSQYATNFFGDEIPEEYIDQRTRKLIFGIVRSEKEYDLQEVVKIGTSKFNIPIKLKDNGKISIPQSKKDFKKLLKLLNDDLLESPLTQSKYETNSKRKIT